MELTLNLYENGNIFYLLTKEIIDNCSADMKFIYERLLEIVEIKSNIKWILEEECLKLKLNLNLLTKKHIFIIDKFYGKAFQYLCVKKAFIVSYQYLKKYLLNGNRTSLPISLSPLYSLTMFNCVICASGVDVAQRKEMKKFVNYMGGIFETDFSSKRTTHLVTNTVRSTKYERAALYNIKIMKEDWVNIIWEKCQNNDISQEKINDCIYKVPVFYNLKITATKIQKGEIIKLKKSIEENGGTYCNVFKFGQIDVLITIIGNSMGEKTEKLQTAISCNVDCLTIDWIKDSIEKGYALPIDNYRINKDDYNTDDEYNYDTEIIEFFKNKKVNVIGFDRDSSDELIRQCKLAGAIITNNYKDIDYLILYNTIPLETKFKESKHIVNEFWFEECKKEGKIVSIEYYHKPIEKSAKNDKILNGLKISGSTYTGKEREYIKMLVELLGAKFTTVYVPYLEKTILICTLPDGVEYNTALKWNLPAVSVKWLLKCYELQRRVPMKPFLIGASTALLNDMDFNKYRFNGNSTECSQTPIFGDPGVVVDLTDNDNDDDEIYFVKKILTSQGHRRSTSQIPLPKESDIANVTPSTSSSGKNTDSIIAAEKNTYDSVRKFRDFINNRPKYPNQSESESGESEVPFAIDHVDTDELNNQVVWTDPSQFERFKYTY